MKPLINIMTAKWLAPFALFLLVFVSCQKEKGDVAAIERTKPVDQRLNGHLTQTKTFSSNVIIRWLNMQLDMLRVPLAAGTGSQASDRVQAYCGIATYEAVVPGMPAYQSLTGQLTGFPEMPEAEPGEAYHWAASANAALAEMNRRLFPTTSQQNKTNMNNLENELQAIYATEVDNATLLRSIAFGKEVALRVFTWATTDGSANINPPYVPPGGPGLWIPTAPTPPVNPYANQRRLLVPGITTGISLAPPPAYSAVQGSPFWEMVRDVYDKSVALTPAQTAMAIYHRDAPGYPGGGHFVSVLSQTFSKAEPTLDVAALAYAKVGIAHHEATIICFINKYQYNLVRPIHYIQTEMAQPAWTPLIPTPNHPEFPSAHALISAAVAEALTNVFGDNFELTLHTYDYLGLAPRSFGSFYAMADEMGDSRVYAGIHYQESCDKANVLGKTIGGKVEATIKFLKE